jgi:cardiolipin synthase
MPSLHNMGILSLTDWLPSASQHFFIASLALLVYVVNARAAGERRAPAAAIAWVMGLALLPYIVLPLYLAFGRRKLPVRPLHPVTPGPEPTHWAPSLLCGLGLAAPAPARVRFHANGAESRAALWELIAAARDTLDVGTFLIGDDPLGRETLSRLKDSVHAGVRVRLLHDGVFALSAPRDALRELKEAGAEIAVFKPIFALRSKGPRNLRNHRKLAVADGQWLWTGGRNLAAEYFTGSEGKSMWLDLSFDLHGGVAAEAAEQFERDWQAATVGRVQLSRPVLEPPPQVEGELAQYLPSGPDQPEDTAQALLIGACFRAQERVLAVTPYFVPDSSLLNALRFAARRGVKVTLVIPEVSNHRLADFVRGRPLRELAQAGAEIRLLPYMSHAKAVVIDDSLALCGSLNLDSRSLLLNYEAGVVFYGAPQIAWLATWATEQAAQGKPFEARTPGLLRDLAEGVLLVVAFQM